VRLRWRIECAPQTALHAAGDLVRRELVCGIFHVGKDSMAKGADKSSSPQRMTRRQPSASRPGRRVEDPKEAYTNEQLAEVGAIILLWNQVETFLDWLIYITTNPPLYLFWDVARRFKGVSAKVELIRIAADRNKILTEDAKKLIKTTLDAVVEYKRLRDNIAHSVPYDLDKGIAHTYKYGTDMMQTIVTVPALNGLYLRLKLLMNELRDVDIMFRIGHPEERRRPFRIEHGRHEQLRPQDVQERAMEALQRQKERLSLPPLPEFPDESEGHPLTEDAETHPRSEGTD
jgi:hypothetical protein